MSIRTIAATALSAAALLLAGCASIEPQVYQREQPALDLGRYFSGKLVGHGMLLDRGGRVTRRFVVTIDARWNGEIGTLDEDFVWSDGEQEKRIWTLRPVAGAPGRWTGTAADVVGEAQGTVAGNALNWRYTFALKTREGRTWHIDFDDWMFLVDDRVLLNRAVMRLWGFRVGEVLISFDRRTP
jgi:starvation-inducible outer membrane lipoprotein